MPVQYIAGTYTIPKKYDRVELRHIRYFLAIADEGNVTRAAARLGIQQPPLSRQMQALEAELETELFYREPRGITLTEAGRAFADDARLVLALVERMTATVRRTARGERGTLAIGFTSSAPFHPFVPRLIRAFRDEAPAVAVTLEESGTSELVTALREERLDVAFVRSPVAGDDIVVEEILNEPMIVALPSGHPLAKRARGAEGALAVRDLANEPFILYRRPTGPGLHDAIIAACRRAGFSPNVVQDAPLIVSTLNLVAAGLGVSIVPESLRRQRLEGVVYRRIKDRPPPAAPLNAAYRRAHTSPALRRFIALVHSRESLR